MTNHVMEEQKRNGFHGSNNEAQLLRLRSMLDDPRLTYAAIGRRFGVSKQRVGQLGQKLGIKGRERERQRILRRLNFSRHNAYSAQVRCVIRAIERLGFQVLPYRHAYFCHNRLKHRLWKQTVLIEGTLCRIYCRSHATSGEGRYVQLYAGKWMKDSEIALLAVLKPRVKIYVIPVSHLLKLRKIELPFNGKYAVGRYKKPNRDWTAYENAWQWVKS